MRLSSRFFSFRQVTAVLAATVLVLAGAVPPAPAAWAAGPPTITSVTPTVVAAGDTVTVQGGNLDPADTKVFVNGVAATVATRAAAGLTFVVPAAAGGSKVTVTTSAGTAVSADDLAVVPSDTVAAGVAGAARITVAGKATLSVPAGKTLLRLFDGTDTDRFAVLIESAVPSGCAFDLALYDPRLASMGASVCTGAGGWLDTTATGVAGTRTLAVRNTSTSAGTLDVTVLKVPADANLGTLPLDGTAKPVTIGTAGQNAYLTFAGTAGQRVAVQTTDASAALLCCYLRWGLYRADGTPVGSDRLGHDYLDATTLPETGTYQLRLNPSDSRTGSVTVTAWTVPADADLGVLPLDGTAKTVTIGNPGQNGYLTFAGTAGQRVTVQTSGSAAAYLCCYLDWALHGPDGTRVGAGRLGNDHLDVPGLPTTGTYQLRLNPYQNRTGSVTVAAWTVPADADLGVLPLDGTAKTVTLGSAGQNGHLTFAGTAGQRVTVQTSGSAATFLCCYLTWGVYRPDGTMVGSGRSGNGHLDVVTLPVTGTYQLRLDPADTRTGSVTVTAWTVPADADLGVLPLDGTPKTVTLGSAGQNGYLTFAGTAGQRIAVQTSGSAAAFLCCYLTWGVHQPDGTMVGRSRSGNGYLDTTTLPVTGTYQLRLDPYEHRTGSVTVTAWTVPADVGLGVLPLDGTPKTVTIGNPGQNGYLTFAGTAGQRVAVQTTDTAASLRCCYLSWAVHQPDGTILGGFQTADTYFEPAVLPVTGTYQVRLDPYEHRTGAVTVTAWTVPADADLGTLPVDGTARTATIGNPGQNGYLTFAGTAGQTVTVTAATASAALLCC
jgi:IPT/TIG domain